MTAGEAPEPGVNARVTIAQVATHAGVSPTTVSHVLSGKRLVGSSTKSRVEEAIRTLGYRPNSAARQLRTNRSRMVAVVVPDITNPYYSVLTRGLADAVGLADYGTYVCNTDGSRERERKFLEDVLDRGADGIVIGAATLAPDPESEAVTHFGTPIVCVGPGYDAPRVDVVASDDRVGAGVATAHLLNRGARVVAMIQGPPRSSNQRDLGYADALRSAGIEPRPDLMVRGDWTRSGGRVAMHVLLGRDPRPDAVFCANDLTAIGAVDAVHELGLSIPDDVAIVGFDDVDAATIVAPRLTTVRNPAYDAGWEAGQLLLGRMSGQYAGTGRKVVLPCPLIQRESA